MQLYCYRGSGATSPMALRMSGKDMVHVPYTQLPRWSVSDGGAQVRPLHTNLTPHMTTLHTNITPPHMTTLHTNISIYVLCIYHMTTSYTAGTVIPMYQHHQCTNITNVPTIPMYQQHPCTNITNAPTLLLSLLLLLLWVQVLNVRL